MALQSYDDILSRVGSGFAQWQPIWGENASVPVALGGNNSTMGRFGHTPTMPGSLPGGVTDFFITSAYVSRQTTTFIHLLAKMVNLGSLNISTNVFTDGSAMPSEAELGNAAAAISGPVFIEVTTVLNGTPGAITITYKNQAGTGGQVSTSQNLGGSAPVRSSGWITLAAGDTGVQDITASARTGGTTPTGIVNFWGIVPICMLGQPVAAGISFRNLLTNAFNPYPLGAGDTVGVFGLGSMNPDVCLGGLFIVGGS